MLCCKIYYHSIPGQNCKNNLPKTSIVGLWSYGNKVFYVLQQLGKEYGPLRILTLEWKLEKEDMVLLFYAWQLANVFLARERKSKYIVAIKVVLKKDVARGCFIDLIQNEIDVQTHLL